MNILALALALPLSQFGAGSLEGWEENSFAGNTRYELVERDGERVLHARCDNSASVLFLRKRIDLRKTPYLRWRWRVDEVLSGLDERSKTGDDYPARIYVVKDGGLLPWRTLAVNYVFASRQPKGADWPNAFTGNAHMLAVRSGEADTGRWHTELRDVRADFQRLHGRELDSIDGVAIMTDCDNTHGQAEAWYGEIEFLAEEPKQQQ